MNKIWHSAFAAFLLLLASTTGIAQQDELSLFDKVERSLKEKWLSGRWLTGPLIRILNTK